MKKILLSFALLLAGIAMNGQTVSKLMKKYKNEPGVELININKNMMKLAKLGGGMFGFGKNEFSFDDNMKVDSLKVLELDECDDVLKKKFLDDFSALDLEKEGYEMLISTNEDDEKVRIYGRKDGNICKEILILGCDKEETDLVQIFGKIDFNKFLENAKSE